ncbi:MAG: hypothetical protein Q4F10_06960 [Corynebacterium glutamicum]|nr:hypothetical protein [Corynebacterium glutamicum]
MYHSCGVNWDVTMVEFRSLLVRKDIEQVLRDLPVDWSSQEVI